MAYLIPDNIQSDKSISTPRRRVAKALAIGLADPATVWYEPPFDPAGELPHFVVLDPDLGVLVIMVVEGEVLGALRGSIRVNHSSGESEIPNPLARASDFGLALRAAIDRSPRLRDIPIAGIVVLPELTNEQAEELGLDSVIALQNCIFRPDLDAVIKSGNGAALLRVFTRSLEGGLDERLTHANEDELRGLIHPDIVIKPVVEQASLFGALPDESDAIKVMDRKQELLARGLGSGHRLIRGVAGSGKSLVLVHRARFLARLLPNKRILVTCFTRALASQLREQLGDLHNVDVVHVDRLMRSAIIDAGLEFPGDRGDWDSVPAVALEAIRSHPNRHYRAILIDEAQDFATETLQFCVELFDTHEPDEQDLVIVADSAQNIFRRSFSWKSAGIKAQGRTQILRVNYRNTREILTFAHDFLMADPSLELDEAPDAEDELSIVPAESSERSGPEQTVTIAADAAGEVAAVLAQVKAWYSDRLPARSIGILLADEKSDQRSRRIVEALAAAQLPHFWVTDPKSPRNRDQVGSTDEAVVVSTIHSAKGLEFPKVIVCGLGGTKTKPGQAVLNNRKLLYVGFTRATEELVVVTTDDSPYRVDLEGGSGRAHQRRA